MIKRLFLIVLDSFGVGAMPDAHLWGDEGSDTLAAVCRSPRLSVPNLASMGLFHIEGVKGGAPSGTPLGAYARLAEKSMGKDTTTGHWEIGGVVSEQAMPTYPNGFPPEVVTALEERIGRRMLCNRPASGTAVIEEYGREHMETGALILYTSADSVLQIAAHEGMVPIEEQYRFCEIAREIMQGEHAVGRIIARPFVGEPGAFVRTTNRHDYSLAPPSDTMCDILSRNGLDVLGVGKIYDIFAGRGITATYRTRGNRHGMEITLELARQDFRGLCFVNLVDFDMLYGHRNDVDGYAGALTEFDLQLGAFLPLLGPEDAVMITADHGCDPSTPSTDHSREYVPMLVCGEGIRPGADLGTRDSFADIAATVQECFGLPVQTAGRSFLQEIKK